jgi:hypothetical protein
MRNISVLIGLIIFIFSGIAFNAKSENFNEDQQSARALIVKLYSIDTDKLINANFGGKYIPERHCQLVSEFLAKEIILKDNQGFCLTPDIYPTAGPEDYSKETSFNPLPKPIIKMPVVNDNLAEVLVLFKNDPSRVRFYMKKTPDGWRIYKSRSDTSADIPEDTKNPDYMRALVFTYFPPSADEIERINHPK